MQKLPLIACTCVAVLLPALPVSASRRVGDIIVYSAREAAGFTRSEGGHPYLDFPGARKWALIEGESEWYPMPVEEVVSAIEGIGFPVRDLDISVIILHVPRVAVVESSTEGSVVFLTPGRGPYPVEHVHYTVVHEIGHAVHGALMPDSRRGMWLRYAELRGFGLNDGGGDIPHAWRPHEIFAEDFRALFGGRLARFDGRIENHDLEPPDEVTGLEAFFLSLADGARGAPEVTLLPNPSFGRVIVRAPAGEGGWELHDVKVLDVRGRMVRRLGPAEGAAEIEWDGRDAAGALVAPGVYIVTGRAGDAAFSRKVIRILP